MKKTLLSIAAVLLASATSFGQGFVQASDNTGFTYDCDENVATGITWENFFPDCGGTGGNGGGGWDASVLNELKFAWGQSNPGRVYDLFEFTGHALDLTGNAVVNFDLKSEFSSVSLPLTYQVWLEKGYAENSVQLTDAIDFAINGTYKSFSTDFGAHIISGQDLSVVDKIVFKFDNCPTHTTTNGNLWLRNVSGGSLVVTAINNSTSVANANLYPNPSTGTTTISGQLNSVANVKITLVDMLGQEVKVITEEYTSSINTTFDVSTLKKGIYSVVTNIDGAPSKSQMLVVR